MHANVGERIDQRLQEARDAAKRRVVENVQDLSDGWPPPTMARTTEP
jgi:hypothetical protein